MKFLFISLILLVSSCQNNSVKNENPDTHNISYVKDKTGEVIKKIELGSHEVDISCGAGENTYAIVSEYKDGLKITECGFTSFFNQFYRIDNSFIDNRITSTEKYYFPSNLTYNLKDSAEILSNIEKLAKNDQYLFSRIIYEYDSKNLLSEIYSYSKLNSHYLSSADTFPNYCAGDYVVPIDKNLDIYVDSALALREIVIYEYDKETSMLQNQYFFREHKEQFTLDAYASYNKKQTKDVFWRENESDTLFTANYDYSVEGKSLSLIPHEVIVKDKFPFSYKSTSNKITFRRTVLIKFKFKE